MPQRTTLTAAAVRVAVLDCLVLGVACFAAYWVVARLLSHLHSVSRADDMVGGMWAVIGTIFVTKFSYQQSLAAGISRLAGTFVSFALCLVYLIFLPFHAWALALLIGLSALVMMLAGRPADAGTAAITTAVLLVLAGVNPQHAWEQPILRLADTAVGVAVGVAAAWLGSRFIQPLSGGDSGTGQAATPPG
jgi:uncharacterized membrane protein YccC